MEEEEEGKEGLEEEEEESAPLPQILALSLVIFHLLSLQNSRQGHHIRHNNFV